MPTLKDLPDAAVRAVLDSLPTTDVCRLFAACPPLRSRASRDYVTQRAGVESNAAIKAQYHSAMNIMHMMYDGVPQPGVKTSRWAENFGDAVSQTYVAKIGAWTVCGAEPLHTSYSTHVCRRFAAAVGDEMCGAPGPQTPVGMTVAVSNVNRRHQFVRQFDLTIFKMQRGSTDLVARGPPLVDVRYVLVRTPDGRKLLRPRDYAVYDWDSLAARGFASLLMSHTRLAGELL